MVESTSYRKNTLAIDRMNSPVLDGLGSLANSISKIAKNQALRYCILISSAQSYDHAGVTIFRVDPTKC